MLKALLRAVPWAPGVASAGSLAGLGAAVIAGAGGATTLIAALAAAGTFYAWGYCARGWPALIHLPRRRYGAVWDAVATSERAAAVGVSGYGSEEELRASAAEPVRNLRELAGITAQDCVLEIGCGVGRIGRELAPLCREWTGADMSAKMLGYARERLKGLANVTLVHLGEASLAAFEDGSFDVVYSTNVFPHIDEMDRWGYVLEALRVLRAGGRIFIDNVGIESDAGWGMFVHDAERFRELERPPYMPRYSTAAELTAYLERAGFGRVSAHQRGAWVIGTGVKG
jgi:SAM-dependent methyltransferase